MVIRAVLRRSALALGLLVLGLPLAVLGLAATESGTRLLVGTLQPLLPVSLPIDRLEGRLLGQLSLHDIDIQAPPHRGRLKLLRLDWQPSALLHGELHVRQLLLRGLDLTLGESAEPETDESPAGPIALPLAFRLEEISLQQSQIRVQDQVHPVENLRLSAHGDEGSLVIDSLEAEAGPLRQLRLSGEIGLAAPHPVNASLGWQARLPEIGRASGSGRVRGNLARLELQHRVQVPFDLHLVGTASLDGEPRFDLSAGWEKLAWPLGPKADYRSDRGNLKVSGSLKDYRLSLEAQLAGRQVPESRLRLEGSGDDSHLQIASLLLETLKGQLNTRGSLGWGEKLTWDLSLEADQLQPSAHWPEVPGTLSAKLSSQGEMAEDGPRLQARIERLEGRLRQQTLAGTGSLRYGSGRLEVEDLNLLAGKNRLKVVGSLAEQADFTFDLDAPGLDQVWPGLAGKLKASGSLRGALQQPNLTLQAEGGGLAFQGYRAGSVRAAVRWDPASAERSSTDLLLADLAFADHRVKQAAVKGPGNLARHQLAVKIDSDLVEADLRAQGGYRDGGWQGQLQAGEVSTPQAGRWKLAAPFELQAGAAGSRLAPHCWRSQGASTCLQGSLDPDGKIAAKGELKALPLALAEVLLAKGDRVGGKLNASFEASGSLDAPRARLRVDLPSASYQPSLKSAPLSLELKALQLKAELDGQRLSGDYSFQLRALTKSSSGTWGESKGQLRAELGDRPRLGDSRIRFDYPDISPLAIFVPALAKSRGKLHLDLRVSGPFDQPNLKGELALTQAAMQVPDIGLSVEDIQISLHTDARDRFLIKGGARSGSGRLDLNGSLTNPVTRPRLELGIKGSNFQVARIPMVEADASPDLKLVYDKGQLDLSGKLHVPKAIIQLKEVPQGSVAVSQDVVVVGKDGKASKKEMPNALVNSRLQITLGDKVSFSGFGLKTRIRGGMEVISTQGHPPMGDGSLSLVEGSFKAYGQDLTIEQGRFVFAGPLDRPNLDIRAVRSAEDNVKAGVMVTGSAKRPEIKVFSVPAKPTAEALSYLLTGSGLSNSGDSDAIRSAAWSMEQGGANLLGGAIARQLGLSELNFGGDTLEESAVTVGKRLSPDVYMRYVTNLFNNEAMVELGYKINHMLEVKVYGGTDQGVDIYYHGEK